MERKRCFLSEEEERSGAEAATTYYETPLTLVTSFKYLGIVLSEVDENWPAVVRNLWKVRRKKVGLTRVMRREGADDQTLSQIYLAVVQSVMLYGN